MDQELKGWDYIEPKFQGILEILKEYFPDLSLQNPDSYKKIQYGIRLKNTDYGPVDIILRPKHIRINIPMNGARVAEIRAKITLLFAPSPQKADKSEADQIYEALKPYRNLPYLDFSLFYEALQQEFEKFHHKLDIVPHLRNDFNELEKAYMLLEQKKQGEYNDTAY